MTLNTYFEELTSQPEVYELFKKRDARTIVRQLLKFLSKSSRRIIKLLFGIDCNDGESMTAKEVAEWLGVNVSYVKRVKKQSLKQMRASPLAEQLREVMNW